MREGTAEIVAVVAMDEKRGIGKDGDIPWRGKIPEDRDRFIDLTMGHPVIMGRKTYDSIRPKYRPLAGRENIVVTRREDAEFPGCLVAHSLEEAVEMALAKDSERACIIGGGEIYQAALPLVKVLYLTHVEGDFNCDTFFPEYQDQFLYQRSVLKSSYQGINYTFEDLAKSP